MMIWCRPICALAVLVGLFAATPAQAVCVDNQTPFEMRLESWVDLLFFRIGESTTMLPANQRTCAPKDGLYSVALIAPFFPMTDSAGNQYYPTGSISHGAAVVTKNTTFRITHYVYQKPNPDRSGVVNFRFCQDC